MKIAIISDTHYGVRNDLSAFHDASKKFLDETFFPYLRKNNITTLFHLGDLVDRRKYINFMTAKRLREDFLDPLNEMHCNTIIIAGNHDTFFKNTNRVNALTEIIGNKYEHIKIYYDPLEVIVDNLKILLLPWICAENQEKSFEMIKKTNATVCMGHLELQGFEMYKGHLNEHGMDSKIFDKFDIVCSGHFHHKSTLGNIHYLGSHSQFTWSDYDDPRGFHVFDTETMELTFIQNPNIMFKKIWYDDSKGQQQINFDNYSNVMVKVITKTKTNPYWFDIFIEQLEKANPIDLQVVEDHLNLGFEDDQDIVNEAEDTLSIFKNYISSIEISEIERKNVERVISNLYNEAMSLL